MSSAVGCFGIQLERRFDQLQRRPLRLPPCDIASASAYSISTDASFADLGRAKPRCACSNARAAASKRSASSVSPAEQHPATRIARLALQV